MWTNQPVVLYGHFQHVINVYNHIYKMNKNETNDKTSVKRNAIKG